MLAVRRYGSPVDRSVAPAPAAHSIIATEAELAALYGPPVPAAVTKELTFISADYRRFIEASPFVLLATAGPEGLDCSPRGGPAGSVVRISDANTLMLPDRRGNNRVDSLRNIVRDPRVGMLFLVPGVGETLRVNGRAVLSTDDELCRSFATGPTDSAPRCVVVVDVEAVYIQCSKALTRSQLWDPANHVERTSLPAIGEMIARIADGAVTA